ncbi:hypothetical protein [Streptomyces sp. NBC_00503]|uniref:hypothetical protein n=1 Tax=Streptomyces sp. NBC_00503 TaxID=2903659 RepID=UPI002E823241|nr:hypothetical protein [Streptomyces sp. NBC_00503]WUD82601.1 hypothetical protein OG490_19790 [Streptomyces sp. NBC_00503]
MSALVSLVAGLWYAAIAVIVFDDNPPAILFAAAFGAAGFVLASAGLQMLTGHPDQALLARRGAWLALLTTAIPLAVWAVSVASSDAPAAYTQLAFSREYFGYVALALTPAVLTLLLVRTRVRR